MATFNHRMQTILGTKVLLWKAMLVILGILAVLLLVAACFWQPLLTSLGYSKTSTIAAANIPNKNVLNPTYEPPQPATPPEETFNRDIDLGQLYASIQVGKDKDHLMYTAATGPSNCSTFQLPTFGAEELCTWINNGKAVIFTLVNGTILAKSKSGF